MAATKPFVTLRITPIKMRLQTTLFTLFLLLLLPMAILSSPLPEAAKVMRELRQERMEEPPTTQAKPIGNPTMKDGVIAIVGGTNAKPEIKNGDGGVFIKDIEGADTPRGGWKEKRTDQIKPIGNPTLKDGVINIVGGTNAKPIIDNGGAKRRGVEDADLPRSGGWKEKRVDQIKPMGNPTLKDGVIDIVGGTNAKPIIKNGDAKRQDVGHADLAHGDGWNENPADLIKPGGSPTSDSLSEREVVRGPKGPSGLNVKTAPYKQPSKERRAIKKRSNDGRSWTRSMENKRDAQLNSDTNTLDPKRPEPFVTFPGRKERRQLQSDPNTLDPHRPEPFVTFPGRKEKRQLQSDTNTLDPKRPEPFVTFPGRKEKRQLQSDTNTNAPLNSAANALFRPVEHSKQ